MKKAAQDSTEILVQGSQSILGFATTGITNWKVWDRFLTINKKPAFHIGNVCETCAFFFERMEGASKNVQVEQLVDRLNAGVNGLDPQIIEDLSKILPDGKYLVSLSQISPSLAVPSGETDYFSHERMENRGIDDSWGIPHNPKTEYYRLATKALDAKRGLFEFLIPTFPHNWLATKRTEEYRDIFALGKQPTAVALSILDIKEPDIFKPISRITSHWCLAHYQLDGHHKAYAAAIHQKPITLISFLALDQGISSADDAKWLQANR